MEITIISPLRFQHTAAEFGNIALVVLTHSRPKVAGFTRIGTRLMREVSTHSRLKAAELYGVLFILIGIVSTHSRLKAAGAPLKSLALSGFTAPISLSSREKREREYNTAFSVTPAFAIS